MTLKNSIYFMDPNKKYSEDKKSFFSEWLEKLQQESWQLELLISGFALFGIFAAKPLILDLQIYIELNSDGTLYSVLSQLNAILWFGRLIFLINLLTHVILRGLWIGAIGLRYVSGDIDYKKLNYSQSFTNFLKKGIGSYDDYIEKLEKICSVLFAYTFLLFLLFFSLVLFLVFFAVYSTALHSIFPDLVANTFKTIFLVAGGIVFIDIISLGRLKRIKNKFFQKYYYFIYRFIGFITLSFLYRPLLYNFLDNKYTRRLFFLSIPYIFLLAFGGKIVSNSLFPFMDSRRNLQESGLIVDHSFYQDLRDEKSEHLVGYDKILNSFRVYPIVLNKYYMDDAFPSVFIKMTKEDKELFKKNKKITPFYKEGLQFTFFNNGEIKQLEKDIQTKIDSLSEMKKEYFDSIEEAKELKNNANLANLQTQIDAVEKNLEILKQNKKQESEDNNIAIMKAFKKNISVKIDAIDYTDSLIGQYYKHPSSGNNGFIFHFSSDSITKGHHILDFERIVYEKNNKDSTYVYKVKLPFIKIK